MRFASNFAGANWWVKQPFEWIFIWIRGATTRKKEKRFSYDYIAYLIKRWKIRCLASCSTTATVESAASSNLVYGWILGAGSLSRSQTHSLDALIFCSLSHFPLRLNQKTQTKSMIYDFWMIVCSAATSISHSERNKSDFNFTLWAIYFSILQSLLDRFHIYDVSNILRRAARILGSSGMNFNRSHENKN